MTAKDPPIYSNVEDYFLRPSKIGSECKPYKMQHKLVFFSTKYAMLYKSITIPKSGEPR